MIEWLQENLSTILISAVIFGVLVAIIVRQVRMMLQGKSSCADCGSCGGACGGACAGSRACSPGAPQGVPQGIPASSPNPTPDEVPLVEGMGWTASEDEGGSASR